MNKRSFSDGPPIPLPQSRASQVKSHLVLAIIVLLVLTLAIGVHTATTALVVVALGHLVLIGLIAGFAAIRRRSRGRVES